MQDKVQKHQTAFDTFLKKAKKDFEMNLSAPLKEKAKRKDFEIIKTIGTGSFGRVCLVSYTGNKKLYAMKIIEKRNVLKTQQIEHTITEMRMLDAFNFQFIVNTDFVFKDNVYLYFVMTFVQGGEMFTHLRKMKKFDESLCKFYASQVILGFEYMHYMGVIYRDLKPENILINADGYCMITDLGFCKKIDDHRTFTLCGTPEYLAPEIILSQGYNYSVDWWAVGILIYEMAAGYPPFYAKDPMKIYEKIVSGKYICPGHFSKPLRDLLANIIQVDRSKRFGSLKNGVKALKSHEWFRNIDFDLILAKKIKPSFKPIVNNDADMSNFVSCSMASLRESSFDEFAEIFALNKPYLPTYSDEL